MFLFRIQKIAFSTLCFLTPLAFGQGAVTNDKEICKADQLYPKEAAQRNNWAYNCGYIGFRHLRWNKFEGHTLKTAPYYPVFSRGTPDSVVSAPTNTNSPCEIVSFYLYRDVTMCPSAPYDLDKACQESRKKALKQGFIDKAQFSEWQASNTAVIFNEDGKMNSISPCRDYPIIIEQMSFEQTL